MRIVLALLSLITCCVAVAQTDITNHDWDAIYTPEKLPGDSGWGVDLGTENSAELTEDGLLRIVDASSKKDQRNCYARTWGARPDRGAIAQATLKVVDCTERAGVCLLVADGTHDDTLTIWPDRIEFIYSGLEYEMDTTDDFHTYQVRISGINVEVWVDGKLAIDGWGKFTNPAYRGRCTVLFGSLSSSATSEAYWKDVRYVSFIIPAERIEGAQDVVIYRKEGVYACFPSLMRLDDGRLYASFGTRSRRSHIDNAGGSARAVSTDDGYTWELTDESFADPRYTRGDGATIVPHARAWVYTPDTELPQIKERDRKWMNVRPGTVAYLGDALVDITMPDGTKKTVNLDSPVPGGCHSFHHASSFLHSGKLWMTAIYCYTSGEGLSGVWVVRSDDDGETWGLAHVAGPIGDKIGLGETALCENGLGEIIAVMRSGDGGTYNTFQSFSSDGGETWSPPQDTGIWGYPCNVIKLKDGRLLCSYGYRREAMGIRAVLSDDGGHTWDLENEIVLRADGHGSGGDNGYPISMQMEDGHIFTIYYLNDAENVTHVAGTHWELPAKE